MTSAFTLGDSLHKMSFDGDGFKRRASSGIWQRADDELSKSFFDAAGEDLAFYLPSDEHRCASSAAACIFFSLLAEESGDDDDERLMPELLRAVARVSCRDALPFGRISFCVV